MISWQVRRSDQVTFSLSLCVALLHLEWASNSPGGSGADPANHPVISLAPSEEWVYQLRENNQESKFKAKKISFFSEQKNKGINQIFNGLPLYKAMLESTRIPIAEFKSKNPDVDYDVCSERACETLDEMQAQPGLTWNLKPKPGKIWKGRKC